MILPEFDYHSPENLAGAVAWLHDHVDSGVRILAGGTDLLVDIRAKIIPDSHRPRCQEHVGAPSKPRKPQEAAFKYLMGLSRISELRGIEVRGDCIHIGSMTSIAEIEGSETVRRWLPALRDGALELGSPLVRNRGTLGGNLCNARPAADTAIPTLALGGMLVLVSSRGERTVDHGDFVLGPGKTVLKNDEILREVIYKVPANTYGSCYLKLANRKALEISVVGAAAAVEFDGELVSSARIALGSVAPKPLLVEAAGDALVGAPLSGKTIQRAAMIAAQTAKPITDHRGSAQYRREMVEILVRRTLQTCLERSVAVSEKGAAR